jgi:hypothetical protein
MPSAASKHGIAAGAAPVILRSRRTGHRGARMRDAVPDSAMTPFSGRPA